jgi:catabolite repression protein CreC
MEDDGENESAPNLDASMEDLDEDAAAETDEMNEGETED